jgi:tRNA(Ile)-lysidine synthase
VFQYNHVLLRAVESKILATIERWNMLPRGGSVGVAVSGGADSVALFRALMAIGAHVAQPAQSAWRLVVLHVNHKLRGSESDDDACFVQDLASQMGLFCDVANLPLNGGQNLEQEARNLRCAWFKQCTTLHNLHNVALGHTRSDQAETVLFRLLRGSGPSGLAAIRPLTNNGIVRPLLEITRAEVREYLRGLGQEWREDSSNRDLSFDRNRIRLDLMPRLAQQWNPAIENTLAQTAEWAIAEEEYWAAELAPLVRETFRIGPGPTVTLHNEAILALPVAVVRRLIREAIRTIRGDLLSIDFAHVERIRALLAQAQGAGRLQVPGVDILRSLDWIRFAPSARGDRPPDFRHPVSPPAEVSLPGGDSSLALQIEEPNCLYNDHVDCLDQDRVDGPLELRSWQPGDRFRPAGKTDPVKLKTLFQDARVPLWDRRTWPVLVSRGADCESVVWTRRFGVNADFAVNEQTQNAIRVIERPQTFSGASFQNENQVPDVERL